MKNFNTIFSFFFSLILFTSCSDDDASALMPIDNSLPDRGVILTFGRYYERCDGVACVEIFQLNNGVLLEDTLDKIPSSDYFYKGNFSVGIDVTPVSVSRLVADFPQDLFIERNIMIGDQVTRDKTVIYIEYEDANEHRFWLINLTSNDFPKYLEAYVGELNNIIDALEAMNTRY